MEKASKLIAIAYFLRCGRSESQFSVFLADYVIVSFNVAVVSPLPPLKSTLHLLPFQIRFLILVKGPRAWELISIGSLGFSAYRVWVHCSYFNAHGDGDRATCVQCTQFQNRQISWSFKRGVNVRLSEWVEKSEKFDAARLELRP